MRAACADPTGSRRPTNPRVTNRSGTQLKPSPSALIMCTCRSNGRRSILRTRGLRRSPGDSSTRPGFAPSPRSRRAGAPTSTPRTSPGVPGSRSSGSQRPMRATRKTGARMAPPPSRFFVRRRRGVDPIGAYSSSEGPASFGLALDVEEGEVFGFLGPTGAGKTTTIKLLMGLIHATRGSATILGLDADRDAVPLKHKIGYVPGELPQFGGWRVSEIVAYIAGLRGDVADSEVEAVAKRLDLDLGRKYREYSHGNKQKLALLLAFAPKPGLLILDEPTSGLDPLHQQEFYGLVRDARVRGATIFISSHVLSEVEHICDRVGIVREGHLATVGPLAQLAGIRTHRVVIEFADAVAAQMLRVPGLEQVSVDGQRVTGMYRGDFAPLIAALAGKSVLTLDSREPTLEEIFLSYYQEPAARQ